MNSFVQCQILCKLGEVPINDNQIRDFKYLLITLWESSQSEQNTAYYDIFPWFFQSRIRCFSSLQRSVWHLGRPSSKILRPLMSFSSVLTSISIFVFGALYVIYTRDSTPLRSIPGPFLASISKLWIFNQQRGYQRQKVDIDLHKKYGPVVRVAPNEVSVSSPEALRKIYGKFQP
jgi:hypothetical protein